MIAIDQGTPIEPGIYFFKHNLGPDVEILRVYEKNGNLFIKNDFPIAKLLGDFSKKLQVTDSWFKEA